MSDWWRAIALLDHNTRVVVAGSALLGIACGVTGTFLTLRRRALLGDAVSHAALPGIAAAFLIGAAWGLPGKSMALLLAGGALSGVIGVGVIMALRRWTTLREDAAVAIVLSVFFGAGIVLLSVIQNLNVGHVAGLEGFIYGRAASMVTSDALSIAVLAVAVILIAIVLAKELRLLCFDEAFARSLGLRVPLLDAVLMALTVAVTVIGMQAVGLILVVALQVIPAAAARFWSDRLPSSLVIAAAIGALSGALGTAFSAAAPDLPSGALIVIAAAVFFVGSLVFGRAHGTAWRWLDHRRAARRVGVEHLLRAVFESIESGEAGDRGDASASIELSDLESRRRFRFGGLRRALRHARRDGWIRASLDSTVALTPAGRIEAERVTARHRLWELYLIKSAGVAPSHVDRDADLVEHVLSPELLARVERALGAMAQSPVSPHPLPPRGERRTT